MSLPDVPQCPEHEDYSPECDACFKEAAHSGLHSFLFDMDGCSIKRLLFSSSTVILGDVFDGDTYLFTVAYGRSYGVGIAPIAEQIVEGTIALREASLTDACEQFGSVSSQSGAARKELERVQGWRQILNYQVIR